MITDDDIRNKIKYSDISMVRESNNILIMLYNLGSGVLLLPKNVLSREEIDTFKKILLTNLNEDKLKLKVK